MLVFKSDSRSWIVSLAAEVHGHPTSQVRSMGGEPTLGTRLGAGMSAIDLSVYPCCRLLEPRVFFWVLLCLLLEHAIDQRWEWQWLESIQRLFSPTCLATPSVLLNSFVV